MEAAAGEMLIQGSRRIGLRLGEREQEQFSLYLDLLQLWGRKMNLTSRLRTGEIVIYHFLDSLSAAPVLLAKEGRLLVDVGAGAGFPALPLKIVLPHLQVLLVEGSRKKVSFCREVVRRLELAGVDVHHGRGEELGREAGFEGRYDWAAARAVGPAAELAKICAPFLRPGGTTILYKASLEGEELRLLEEEVGKQGAALQLHPLHVPFLDAPRTLALVKKRST